MVVGLSVDNFLGFNVQFAGALPLTKGVDLMLIGTVFTAVQFADNGVAVTADDGTITPPKNDAFGLFVPVGPAVKFELFEKKLSVMPFLEVANGGLLSGQRFNPAPEEHTDALAEGLVPGVSVGAKLGSFSASLKGAYFFPIQNLGPHRVQLLRITASTLYETGRFFGVGLMTDWLAVLDKTDVEDFEPFDDFLFVGPELDLRFTEHALLAVAGGPDFARPAAGVENDGRTFYRVTLQLGF